MKKIALLLLVIFPLHAGRIFVGDPKETLNDMKSKLLSIRTRFGYDLPSEEESTTPISLDAQLVLIKEFEVLLHTYRLLSETLKTSFTTEQEKKIFHEVASDFEKDKKRYESFTARAFVTIRRISRPRNRLVEP